MVEMNAGFKRHVAVIDYEKESACYAQYGLRHGEFNMNGEVDEYKFRTSVQLRKDTIDIVRKYTDELYARLTGDEFKYLVSVWRKIQETCRKTGGKITPRQVHKDKDSQFDIGMESFFTNGKWYPKLFFRGEKDSGITVSLVEVMCNTKDDLTAIYNRWLQINAGEVGKPLVIPVGMGNPKANKSTPTTDMFSVPPPIPTPQKKKKRKAVTAPAPATEIADALDEEEDGIDCPDALPLSDEEIIATVDESTASKFWKKEKITDVAKRVAKKARK